jgi:hypothetical protein
MLVVSKKIAEILFGADPKDVTAPLADMPPATAKGKIVYTYGGYPFSNPAQDCEKILTWFNDHIALSNEQAVRKLQIGSLSNRISELQQRGYVIHSQRWLAEVTSTHEYHSTVYALHRDMPTTKEMPNPHQETNAWIEEVNLLLQNHLPFVDWNSDAADGPDLLMFIPLFQKMQARCNGVA